MIGKKQIEEMRESVSNAMEQWKEHCRGGHCRECEYYFARTDCQNQMVAEALYNAGYRKQSEWISVEERLPTAEEEERGIVGIVNGHNGKIRFTDAIIFVNYDFDEKEWWSQDYDLTDCKVKYWMPLPEAPKMKGGAE